jgi:flagellar biosynthetic protein FlhB
MAQENQDGQEKTEQPTSKRLQDAKKKGQVPRSRELNSMAITLLGGLVLVGMSGYLGHDLWQLMTHNFTIPRSDMFDPMAMVRRLAGGIQDGLMMLLPFFMAIIAIAIASSVALGGVAFSGEALTLNFSKLDPIKGMKRVFSLKGLLEVAKALAKFALIGGTTALVLWLRLDDFLNLSRMELGAAVARLGGLVGWSFIAIAATLILIAAVDVPFQIWDHRRQLKMTRQEVRDELKETEGRPEVKSRIRSLQREMARRRMMEEVPKADVIVTNPTHYAVALRYDQQRMLAPKVVAKGVNLVAANIKKVAEEHAVPLVEAPPLARALYFSTELGQTIPSGLYLAVAKVLAYVFQLRTYRSTGGDRPEIPSELPIPDEFQQAEREDADEADEADA